MKATPNAAEELPPLVYEELRKLAAHKMAAQPAGQTLQTTALVHEACLRDVRAEDQTWENRPHFFAAAAEAMWRTLVENARHKVRLKRGEGQQRMEPGQRVSPYLPVEPRLKKAVEACSGIWSRKSDPPDAGVSIKPCDGQNANWKACGPTPLKDIRLARGLPSREVPEVRP